MGSYLLRRQYHPSLDSAGLHGLVLRALLVAWLGAPPCWLPDYSSRYTF